MLPALSSMLPDSFDRGGQQEGESFAVFCTLRAKSPRQNAGGSEQNARASR